MSGDVTILEELSSKKISGVSRTFVRCRCHSCGDEFVARKDHILRKKKPQLGCGCNKSKPSGRKAYNAKPDGMASARLVWNGYRIRSKKKNIAFELSFEDFLVITKQNCRYCDSPPNQGHMNVFKEGVRAGQKRLNGSYKYNGIDRLDPMSGYVHGNIAPCCKYCNSAKSNRSEVEFIEWAKMLHKRIVGE